MRTCLFVTLLALLFIPRSAESASTQPVPEGTSVVLLDERFTLDQIDNLAIAKGFRFLKPAFVEVPYHSKMTKGVWEFRAPSTSDMRFFCVLKEGFIPPYTVVIEKRQAENAMLTVEKRVVREAGPKFLCFDIRNPGQAEYRIEILPNDAIAEANTKDVPDGRTIQIRKELWTFLLYVP